MTSFMIIRENHVEINVKVTHQNTENAMKMSVITI